MFEILKLYVRWWKTWKSLPVTSWVRGAALYRKGKFAEAESHYRRGLRRHASHPARFSARLDLAYCLFKRRELSDAEEQLRYVLSCSPRVREGYLRLARLQIWTGHSLEAAWTMRKAIQKVPVDAELAATFLHAVLDNGGPTYLLKEGISAVQKLAKEDRNHPLLDVAFARLEVFKGNYKEGRLALARLAVEPNAPLEAVILLAELLMREEKVSQARFQLRRALAVVSDHPRILSLLAESYLRAGAFYNPEFARQLAVTACQHTQWLSPRAIHILAEAYYHTGDKISALLTASRAKHLGSRLLGNYRDARVLDKLIESLSSGTQA